MAIEVEDRDRVETLNKIYETSRSILDIQKYSHGIVNDSGIDANSVASNTSLAIQKVLEESNYRNVDKLEDVESEVRALKNEYVIGVDRIVDELRQITSHLKKTQGTTKHDGLSKFLSVQRIFGKELNEREKSRMEEVEERNNRFTARQEKRNNSIWMRRIDDFMTKLGHNVATKNIANIQDERNQKAGFGSWLTDFTLGRVLGTRLQSQAAVETEKGIKIERAEWNSRDSVALTTVIPGWLSKIHTALTGSNESFDYRTGRFRDTADVLAQEEEFASRRLREAQRRAEDFQHRGFFSGKRFLKIQKELEDERQEYAKQTRSSELQSLTGLATGEGDNRTAIRLRDQGKLFDEMFGTDVLSNREIQDNASKYRTGIEKLFLNLTGTRNKDDRGLQDIINGLRSALPGRDKAYAVSTTDIDYSKMLDKNSLLNPILQAIDALTPGTQDSRLAIDENNAETILNSLLDETAGSRYRAHSSVTDREGSAIGRSGRTDLSSISRDDKKGGILANLNFSEGLISNTAGKPWLQLIYEHLTGDVLSVNVIDGEYSVIGSNGIKGSQESGFSRVVEKLDELKQEESTDTANGVKGFLEKKAERKLETSSMESINVLKNLAIKEAELKRDDRKEDRGWKKKLMSSVGGIKRKFDRNAIISALSGIGGKLIVGLGLILLVMSGLPTKLMSAIGTAIKDKGGLGGIFRNWFKGHAKFVLDTIRKSVAFTARTVGNIAKATWAKFGDAAVHQGKKLLRVMDSYRVSAIEWSKEVIRSNKFLSNGVRKVRETATGMVDTVRGMLHSGATRVVDTGKTMMDATVRYANTARDLLNSGAERLVGIGNRISDTFKNISVGLVDRVKNAAKIVTGPISKVVNNVKEPGFFANVANKTKGFVSGAVDTVKSGAKAVKESGFVSGAIDAVKGGYNTAKGVVSSGIDKVKDIGGGVFSFIKEGFSKLLNGIKNTFKGGFGEMSTRIGGFIKNSASKFAGVVSKVMNNPFTKYLTKIGKGFLKVLAPLELLWNFLFAKGKMGLEDAEELGLVGRALYSLSAFVNDTVAFATWAGGGIVDVATLGNTNLRKMGPGFSSDEDAFINRTSRRLKRGMSDEEWEKSKGQESLSTEVSDAKEVAKSNTMTNTESGATISPVPIMVNPVVASNDPDFVSPGSQSVRKGFAPSPKPTQTSPDSVKSNYSVNVPSKPEVENALMENMVKHGITDPKEQAALMAQTAHESANFTAIEENLNYSPSRLNQTFKSVKGEGQARQLVAGGPPAIAEHVYGGRRDLGNTEMGDGWKYRGRGFMQLTGKHNYQQVGKVLGVDLVNNPDLAATDPNVAAGTAIAWWKQQGSRISDAAKAGDTRSVSKIVNGGYNGLQDRIGKTNFYLSKIEDIRSRVGIEGKESEAAPPSDSVKSTGLAGSMHSDGVDSSASITSPTPEVNPLKDTTAIPDVGAATSTDSSATIKTSTTPSGMSSSNSYDYLDNRSVVNNSAPPVVDTPKSEPTITGGGVDKEGIAIASNQLSEAETTNLLLRQLIEKMSTLSSGNDGYGNNYNHVSSREYNIGGNTNVNTNAYGIGGNTQISNNHVLGAGPSGNQFDIGISQIALMEAAS